MKEDRKNKPKTDSEVVLGLRHKKPPVLDYGPAWTGERRRIEWRAKKEQQIARKRTAAKLAVSAAK